MEPDAWQYLVTVRVANPQVGLVFDPTAHAVVELPEQLEQVPELVKYFPTGHGSHVYVPASTDVDVRIKLVVKKFLNFILIFPLIYCDFSVSRRTA